MLPQKATVPRFVNYFRTNRILQQPHQNAQKLGFGV